MQIQTWIHVHMHTVTIYPTSIYYTRVIPHHLLLVVKAVPVLILHYFWQKSENINIYLLLLCDVSIFVECTIYILGMTNPHVFAIVIGALGAFIFGFPLENSKTALLGLIFQLLVLSFCFLLGRDNMLWDYWLGYLVFWLNSILVLSSKVGRQQLDDFQISFLLAFLKTQFTTDLEGLYPQ